MQLRESISQDQEKTEALKSQIQELERNIQNVDAKIQHNEVTLKDLRKLEDQISTKTAKRSTLFEEKEKQFAALAEENQDTDEQLEEWKIKFDVKITESEYKINKWEREVNDTETKSSLLRKKINEYIWDISKLQTEAEAHVSLCNERDSMIQNLFARHNLGSVPSTSLSNEVALNLTNRIKSRLMDLDRDLEDKKKSNELELKVAWDRYMDANDQWKDTEARKQAKVDSKSGLLKRIEEKENERDSFELQISNVNLTDIDEKEKDMKIMVERKANQLAERKFDSTRRQKQTEIYTIEQEIKSLNREKDIMAADSVDRVKLMDEIKERVKGVLKGRLPPEKDLKKEIAQALRITGKLSVMMRMLFPVAFMFWNLVCEYEYGYSGFVLTLTLITAVAV
ncbi:hypothetical protein TEA_017249 [Camellia sinensis var. sinensis]|uniref:Uncharacterized protein n=1 Tax=Camellia sinensis var. sinensis TaxID=542762 RepID=A0A4S4ETR8_CAMSN|nr:hypothetical protein TEA_017249 [Camellia sinensis var. sinensis]